MMEYCQDKQNVDISYIKIKSYTLYFMSKVALSIKYTILYLHNRNY